MELPGRSYNAGNSYQYGFGGKRKDNEMYGEGNAYDYGDRIYNPKIVKWLSVDPLQQKYPYESPYAYVGNNPIFFIDVKGRFKIKHLKGDDRKAALKVIEAIKTEVNSWKDENDPRFLAFQAATGAPSIAYLKNNVLKDGKGPEFHWGNNKTFSSDDRGDDQGHPTLLVSNGQGFTTGSSYAITKGQRIYFDEAIKETALRTIEVESMETTKYTFTLPDNSMFSGMAKEAVAKANTFLGRIGLHEVAHFTSGMARVIPPAEGNTGVINYTDPNGNQVTDDRGDYFEMNAYGELMQYNSRSAGIIPLLIFTNRSKWCQTGANGGYCFPTKKERDAAIDKINQDLRHEVEARGHAPESNNKSNE
jgi:RHS repeat-associated protein